MKVLVAGGAGFIGSTLVDRLLAEGHAVDVVDDLSSGRLSNLADARSDRSAELHIHQVDVRGPEVSELVERRGPDVVFQLAAPPKPDPVEETVSTVVGTLRLLEGARRAGSRKVVALLDATIFGDARHEPSLREADAGEPSTARGVAWLAVIEYLRLYRDSHGIDFTALVVDDVYGPRRRDGALVQAAGALLHGDRPPDSEDQERIADLVFVDDLVDALVRASDRAGGLLLNLGWGHGRRLRDAVRIVADAAGHPDLASPTAGEGRGPGLDAARARIHLGWSPWTPLEEGVAALLRSLAR